MSELTHLDEEGRVAMVDTTAKALVDTEALARLLLRAESVASSYMRGSGLMGGGSSRPRQRSRPAQQVST